MLARPKLSLLLLALLRTLSPPAFLISGMSLTVTYGLASLVFVLSSLDNEGEVLAFGDGEVEGMGEERRADSVEEGGGVKLMVLEGSLTFTSRL